MRDGCLCACVAVQATMVSAQSGNAMRKVVRGLLALTLMMINVQTGGIRGERKKLPCTLSDTPYPKAQRQCVRTYAEDTKTRNGAAAADDFCVVPLCIELCPFAETDDSPPTPCEHRYAFSDCADAAEERYLHETLAMLQESYANAAKPYMDRLVALHSRSLPQMLVKVEQAQALGLLPANSQ
jgi:hypothetical protein